MKYCLPISPFSDENIELNNKLKNSSEADVYLSRKYFNKSFVYTNSGREAISIALAQLNLSREDNVTIFTTTDNFYISSCVTDAIEKFCNWSRDVKANTKVIIVNHEFGFPKEDLVRFKKYNVPIIEDCAFSFDSQNQAKSIGLYSDFLICSCPKYFPISTGGMLFYDKDKYTVNCILEGEKKKYIQNVISHNIKYLVDIKKQRQNLYRYYTQLFDELGWAPRFNLTDNISPGAFIFTTNGTVDLTSLKIFLQESGVECSVFYGEEAFFLPCNQNMSEKDVENLFLSIKEFISKTDD